MATTYAQVLALLSDLTQAQAGLLRAQKETDRKFQETDCKFQETARLVGNLQIFEESRYPDAHTPRRPRATDTLWVPLDSGTK